MASNHNNFSLSSLAKINTDLNFLSNLTIKCKDGQYMVNTLCWASISEVFAAMLQNQMKEATTLVIELPLFSVIAIKQLYLALFTGSSLCVEYLLEYTHFAHIYNNSIILNSCTAKMLELAPYQCFFTYNNNFNLNIYNNLLTNFFKINSYNYTSLTDLDVNGDALPVYDDAQIYKDLWAKAKLDLFNQKVVTNIIISYLSSSINDVDIFDTNVNDLKLLIKSNTKTLTNIDNKTGFNEVRGSNLKKVCY